MAAKTYIGDNQVKKVFVGNNEVKKIYVGNNLVYENGPEPLVYYADTPDFQLTVPKGYTLCTWHEAIGYDRNIIITQNGNTIFDGYIMSDYQGEFPVSGGDELTFWTGDMHTSLDLEIILTAGTPPPPPPSPITVDILGTSYTVPAGYTSCAYEMVLKAEQGQMEYDSYIALRYADAEKERIVGSYDGVDETASGSFPVSGGLLEGWNFITGDALEARITITLIP